MPLIEGPLIHPPVRPSTQPVSTDVCDHSAKHVQQSCIFKRLASWMEGLAHSPNQPNQQARRQVDDIQVSRSDRHHAAQQLLACEVRPDEARTAGNWSEATLVLGRRPNLGLTTRHLVQSVRSSLFLLNVGGVGAATCEGGSGSQG